MFIQNISRQDCFDGNHINPGKAVLIQISDPGNIFPVPSYNFAKVFHFEFLDVDERSDVDERFKCSLWQGKRLVEILQNALEDEMNVIVHCTAGICRSGAVVEVGVMMGFEDTNKHRQPNTLVKFNMMKSLGWTYD